MNLKTATIIALIFTAIGASISLLNFLNSISGGFGFMRAGWYGPIVILNMLKDSNLALFFIVLYSKQKPAE